MRIKAHNEVTSAHHDNVGDFRVGHRNTKQLLTGQEGSPTNYSFTYGGAGSAADWTTPRHRHTFEQIRYTACGDYVMKDGEVLPEGWIAYFPESVFYGPQVKHKNLSMLTLQFGGPSGIGYWSDAQRKQAFDSLLAKGGKFEEGMYVWTDADGRKHQQDAGEAVEAEAAGHAVEYPEPRYKDIVVMNPANFSWVKDRENAGVGRKLVGAFTERDIRIAFIRMDKGSTMQFGAENSDEVLFLKDGSVTHQNQRYGQNTGFGTFPEDMPETLTAVEPSELIYIKLPTF